LGGRSGAVTLCSRVRESNEGPQGAGQCEPRTWPAPSPAHRGGLGRGLLGATGDANAPSLSLPRKRGRGRRDPARHATQRTCS
jgi:hypothetical protein